MSQEQRELARELRDELSKFIFTAARDWQRSLRVTPDKRDLLIDALDALARQGGEWP